MPQEPGPEQEPVRGPEQEQERGPALLGLEPLGLEPLGLEPLGPALLVRRPGCFQEQRRAFGARNLRKGLLRQVGE